MSKNEKLELIGWLMTELQKSAERLAALEYKAMRIAERLNVMGAFAQKMSHREQDLSPEFFFCGRPVKVDEAEYAEAMNYPALLALAEDIRSERARLSDLEKRKKQMGL